MKPRKTLTGGCEPRKKSKTLRNRRPLADNEDSPHERFTRTRRPCAAGLHRQVHLLDRSQDDRRAILVLHADFPADRRYVSVAGPSATGLATRHVLVPGRLGRTAQQ